MKNNQRTCLGLLALFAGVMVARLPATAQQAPSAAGSAFSFAVYGDLRPMMYLPDKEGQPDLTKLFVEMFGLVMPPKLAEEVVKRDVKMFFDPVTKALTKIIMPFELEDRSHDVDG